MKLLLKRKSVAELFLLYIHGGGFASSLTFLPQIFKPPRCTELMLVEFWKQTWTSLQQQQKKPTPCCYNRDWAKKERGLRKPEPSVGHISSSCPQGGEPGLRTALTTAIPKHAHVLTVWEVRDSYQATNLHPSLGQVSTPFHASKIKTALPRCLLRL